MGCKILPHLPFLNAKERVTKNYDESEIPAKDRPAKVKRARPPT